MYVSMWRLKVNVTHLSSISLQLCFVRQVPPLNLKLIDLDRLADQWAAGSTQLSSPSSTTSNWGYRHKPPRLAFT